MILGSFGKEVVVNFLVLILHPLLDVFLEWNDLYWKELSRVLSLSFCCTHISSKFAFSNSELNLRYFYHSIFLPANSSNARNLEVANKHVFKKLLFYSDAPLRIFGSIFIFFRPTWKQVGCSGHFAYMQLLLFAEQANTVLPTHPIRLHWVKA